MINNDGAKKNKESDMNQHKHCKDESNSAESESCCSEEFNKFFQHPIDKEFMNFHEIPIESEKITDNQNKSGRLWGQLSQLITGDEHDDKQFKNLINKVNEFN